MKGKGEMDFLHSLIAWASTASTSNFFRTTTAILAIPGACWGIWLFVRWLRGRGMDKIVDTIQLQAAQIQQRLVFLQATIERRHAIQSASGPDEAKDRLQLIQERNDLMNDISTMHDVLDEVIKGHSRQTTEIIKISHQMGMDLAMAHAEIAVHHDRLVRDLEHRGSPFAAEARRRSLLKD